LPSLPRLYAILDFDTLTARGLEPAAVFDVWLDAGIRLIQLRAKSLGSGAMLAMADRLAERARAAGAIFIVNDRADIAAMAGADGVHVGQGDLTPTEVRNIGDRDSFSLALRDSRTENDSRSRFVVGLSTHTLDQVRAGLDEPADYVAIGPVFPTVSKVHADPAIGMAMVTTAASCVGRRPLVAIGGITLETAPGVLGAGATSVAVISDLLKGDLAGRARAFVATCR